MIDPNRRCPPLIGRRLATRLLLAAVSAVALAAAPAIAEQLNVAVAANFSGTLQKLAPKYQQASGNELLISSGSSGQFYTQIKEGAPFDVLLSADTDRPKQLEAEGLTVPGSRFTYATGTLVLWSAKADVVDKDGKVLVSGSYRMLGIAEPHNAPYGSAAQQVLTALGLWDKLNQDKKLAVGENINQAWQFAATGNVDMAFVALSQVSSDGVIAGSYWLPPQSMYTPIDQDAVVLIRSSKRATAQGFLTWLRKDPQAIATIKSAGYHVGQ
jgi:molybdate transport system substrate-binding protein